MPGVTRPTVLCVGASATIVDPLALGLSRHCRVVTATSSRSALERIGADGPFAVILTGMELPDMDGVALLRIVRERFPDMVRLLSVEQMDLPGALSAVNDGGVFGLVPVSASMAAVRDAVEAAAVEHERLIAAKRLSEQTLHGGIKALVDTLALANPVAFARAVRVRDLALELARRAEVNDETWTLDVAAMLSQLGVVAYPSETTQRWYREERLTEEEQLASEQVPTVTVGLLASIPQLATVREIILYQTRGFDGSGTPEVGPKGKALPAGSRILRLVNDYQTMVVVEGNERRALVQLRAHPECYDPDLLTILASMAGAPMSAFTVRWVELRDLKLNMVIEKDVRAPGGALLIPRDFKVTDDFLGRIESFAPAFQRIPVCISHR